MLFYDGKGINMRTTLAKPTHFLVAGELIEKATQHFGIPNENWPYPVGITLGNPDVDPYYAEIFTNGMDYTCNIWCICALKYGEPVVFPMLLFSDYTQHDKFNEHDLHNLMRAMLVLHRERELGWEGAGLIYNDTVWSSLKCLPAGGAYGLTAARFAHHSQPEVRFGINEDLIPHRCRRA